MNAVFEINNNEWKPTQDAQLQQSAVDALEQGQVVYMPKLSFDLTPDEKALLRPDIVSGKAKNICFDSRNQISHSTSLQGKERDTLNTMMRRYADFSCALISHLMPYDMSKIEQARTSFRPVEVFGRPSSYRKDDTRLHVDAFPSTPMHGKRILRVFNNVNPDGKARVWRLGEPFQNVAQRFLPKVRAPFPGSATLLRAIKATRTKRTAYDHYMMRIHNAMKADVAYQKSVSQTEFHFPPGATWLVFTDQASHAAMTGQYLFEQSFYLPVSAMMDESRSPLRVLEEALKKTLV